MRLPDDAFAGLERIRPEGVSLAEVARAVIAKVVPQPELPRWSLRGRGCSG